MTSYGHTYGPSCSLHTELSQYSLRPSDSSTDAPKIRAQFFYSSALPIDDPLSRVPPPSSNSTAALARVPPRPFSVFDNTALEEAWQKTHATRISEEEQRGPKSLREPDSVKTLGNLGPDRDNISESVGNDEKTHSTEDGRSAASRVRRSTVAVQTRLPRAEPSAARASVNASVNRQHHGDLTLCDSPDHIPFDHAMPVSSDETGNDEFEGGRSKRRRRSPFHRDRTPEKCRPKDTTTSPKTSVEKHKSGPGTAYGSSPNERDTTGTPFLRVASRSRRPRSGSSRSAGPELGISQNDGGESTSEDERERPSRLRPAFTGSWSDQSGTEVSSHQPLSHTDDKRDPKSRPQLELNTVYTTVGISRLHVVEMPELRVSKQQAATELEQAG